MASLHPLADVDDGQPLRRFTEGLRQKYRETQSGDNDSDENELYDTMSVGYEDKSTQTEPASSVDQTLDSLPELPSYEISQIISDVIDNLPPGSLLPLEESMFAPGSKRNLEYQAASKAGKGSLSRMSSNGKPKVSGWNDFQSSKEASKPDQTGFTFSNRFSSLADSGGPEKVSQATSKSLIGPGLYAKSVRSVSKEIDSEEVKSQIHTYSPGPGLLLRYESVERSPTRKDPTVAEKPRASSLYAPSTLHDAAETIISSQEMHLPPHLRAAQSSDPVKSSKASIKEPIHVGSAKAFHLDQPIVGEITPLTASAIKSIEVEGEDPSLPPSLTTSVVESVALEGEGPSPHVIKEDQSSPSTEKLPPHLRKAESQITQQDLHNPIAKSNESTSSPGSSTEKLAPHEKGKTPVPQQVLHVIDTNTKSNASITPPFSRTDNQVAPYEKSKTPAPQQILPVTGTDTKPNESTLSPFSKTDLLAPHRKSKALILQQVAPVIDTDTKPNESKVSPFFSTDKLKPQEKNEAPVAQHIIPVIDDIKTELIESMSSSFSSTDKLPPHKKGKNPVPQQVLPVGDTSTKLNNSKLSPLSGTEKLAPQGKSEAPVVRKSIPVTDTNTKPNESTLWPSSGTLDAISEPIRALGALGALGASSSKDVAPNLKEALYFKAWPKSEPRDTPAAEIRRVVITNLPSNATPSFVTSVVSGGPLEQIHLKGSTAQVLFLHAKDCQRFYDATANGVAYSFEGRKGIAHVDKAPDVDVVSGQVRTFIELSFTRCVRATGIGSDFTVAKLKEKAAYKNRNVEDVVLGTNESGLPFAIIRFCDIRHAVQFKHALEREEEWEDCNIHFSPDPCA